ncbi:MAG TPA: hypothetical protein VGG27_07400 [Magnetospirillaceae bacterium]|jgi:hypothetical protein
MADSKGKAPMIHMMTTSHLKRAIAMDQQTTEHINSRLQADVIARTATTAHIAQALSGPKQSGETSGSAGQGSQTSQSSQSGQGGKKE